MEGSQPLGRLPRGALVALGSGSVAAFLLLGYGFFINIVVGLAEPVHPTGTEWALIWSYVLAGSLLLATGIVSLLCRTRRLLPVLAALAAATAAAVALSFILLPRAERARCEHYVATQRGYARADPMDLACLKDR